MSRKCTVCTHEQLEKIDCSLINDVPFRKISKQYGVSTGALQRHKRDHIAKDLITAQQQIQAAGSTAHSDLWQRLKDLDALTETILKKAIAKDKLSSAFSGIQRLHDSLKIAVQMQAIQSERGVEIDPVALAHEVMEFLSNKYPDAHKGLLEHLKAQYEQFRNGMSQS